MAITLNIGGTVIEFPSSSASPNWAPALIEFAQATAEALQAFTGPFDVPPQVQNIDAYNPGISINLQNAVFPISDVRSVELTYAIYRETSLFNAAEVGSLKAVYNPNNASNLKWEVERIASYNPVNPTDPGVEFTFLDTGQVQFTTSAIAGTDHAGTISFQAKALLQNI